MSSTAENPTEAAQRLEHALERIALAMASAMAAQAASTPHATDSNEAAAIRARLDALIGKLRTGLARSSNPSSQTG